MKIAYLIIAHDNFDHLKRLIRAIQTEYTYFFIHIDRKAPQVSLDEFYHVQVIPKHYAIKWGGFSMVEATIELLKTACHFDAFDRYILLSGVDYPIKSNTYIKELFEKNQTINFIEAEPMPTVNKPFDRLFCYRLECERNVTLKSLPVKAVNRLVRLSGIRRPYPQEHPDYRPFAGSQWWAFNDAFVDYLLNFLSENAEWITFFKHTFVPDEMFFQTIIMNSPFAATVRPTLTYVDWVSGPPYPYTIQKLHLNLFKNEFIYASHRLSIYCFARKFNDDSAELINEIEKIRSKY
ncbi:glycosyl transferase family 14 [Sporolactobacillus sp. THM7-4]|nr:glycosyl transferase family 14 [Sporolactobacillus sp. THM7-4]